MSERFIRVDSNDYRRYGKGILFANGCALNEVATAIFDMCDGHMNVDEIVDCLYEEYDCDKELLLEDVSECIRQMLENKLIVKLPE